MDDRILFKYSKVFRVCVHVVLSAKLNHRLQPRWQHVRHLQLNQQLLNLVMKLQEVWLLPCRPRLMPEHPQSLSCAEKLKNTRRLYCIAFMLLPCLASTFPLCRCIMPYLIIGIIKTAITTIYWPAITSATYRSSITTTTTSSTKSKPMKRSKTSTILTSQTVIRNWNQ